MSSDRLAAYDRLLERRRAVALARHFREAEGLSITQIADRLGRSPATIKAYFYDPTGEKARAVKARYQGVCRGCGAYTQPRNGKGDAYAYCKRCHPGAIQPKWTRELVISAMLEWRDRYGRLPSSYDWSRTHARERGEHALRRLAGGHWPAASAGSAVFGSGAAARQAPAVGGGIAAPTSGPGRCGRANRSGRGASTAGSSSTRAAARARQERSAPAPVVRAPQGRPRARDGRRAHARRCARRGLPRPRRARDRIAHRRLPHHRPDNRHRRARATRHARRRRAAAAPVRGRRGALRARAGGVTQRAARRARRRRPGPGARGDRAAQAAAEPDSGIAGRSLDTRRRTGPGTRRRKPIAPRRVARRGGDGRSLRANEAPGLGRRDGAGYGPS